MTTGNDTNEANFKCNINVSLLLSVFFPNIIMLVLLLTYKHWLQIL